MSEILTVPVMAIRADWVKAGRPIPLEVTRSGYDDTTVSWEVLYTESPWDGNTGCSSPIAEFTDWAEAHQWAITEARKSKRTDDSRATHGPLTSDQQARADYYDRAGTNPAPYPGF